MPRRTFRVSESSETELTFPEDIDGNVNEDVKNPGCYFTYTNGFIAVLAAILLAVVVGLIVGLAHPARFVDHRCPTTPSPTTPPTPDPETEWQRCVNISWERGDCLPGLVCTTQRPTVTSPTKTPTSPTTTAPPTNIRLPDTLKPTHYNLLLTPEMYNSDPKKFSFNGTVDIYFICEKETYEIIIHSKKLDTPKTSMSLTGMGGAKIKISSVDYDSVAEFLRIRTGSQLAVGVQYVLIVDFWGPLTKDLIGLYLSSYSTGHETRYLMTSHLQPTDARKVFPCFDEPALKATFNISIDRRDGYTSMSNTQVYKTETRGNGWNRDHFSTTPVMSTYILAFIVSDFECVLSNTTDHKKVEICARPNVMDQTEFAASIAGEMQQFYEEYHNRSIPLPKLGHVGVPDFSAGAMENWGLIIYRETALLYDPATSTAENRQRVAVVIGHELAHMWFGNLVTPAWWDDLWLNEGFASYLETLGVDYVKPDWQIYNTFIRDDLLPAMDVDALMTSHPVYLPVENPSQINELFDTITYSKGASIIRMMKFFLGEDTFRWGLANYLRDKEFSAANHADLFFFMTKQAKADGKTIDVASVMGTWIMQKGFPVITFEYDNKNGRVTLTQKHFVLTTSKDSRYNPHWKVPISVVNGSECDWDLPTTGWLSDDRGSLDVAPGAEWVIGNVQFQYFYRVNYDDRNWKALTTQLKTNHSKIDVANRLQIIDDTFNLGRAGETSQILALEISKYLKLEKEYLPWVGADRGFSYLSDMLDLTPDYGLLNNYVRSLLKDVYSDLGWEDDVAQPHLTRLMRATILGMACHHGNKDCAKTASHRYQSWMENSTSIPSGIQPLVFCQGIRMGLEEEWNFAFDRYRQSNSGAEKKTLLIALACTRENWILKRYLDHALEEREIRQQDFSLVLIAVSTNPLGRRMAWDFFVANWETLLERFGDGAFTLSKMVEGITKTFSSQRELEELEAFLSEHPKLGTAKAAFENAVEATQINLEWRRRHEKEIFDWLKKESL